MPTPPAAVTGRTAGRGVRRPGPGPERAATRGTLVAGIGNLFLGDDGFGGEVARALAGRALPPSVTVTDYGIRGVHLAYDLLDPWDRLILVDVIPSRGNPGAVHVVELDRTAADPDGAQAGMVRDAHGMTPDATLDMVRTLGGTVPPTVLVGCEAERPGRAHRAVAGGGSGRRAGHRCGAGPAHRCRPSGGTAIAMCLGIPGRVVELVEGYAGQIAVVDVLGTSRQINVGMLEEPVEPGQWVLIHLGFAVEVIDQDGADRAMSGLQLLGQGHDGTEGADR